MSRAAVAHGGRARRYSLRNDLGGHECTHASAPTAVRPSACSTASRRRQARSRRSRASRRPTSSSIARNNKAISITIWESEDALLASAARRRTSFEKARATPIGRLDRLDRALRDRDHHECEEGDGRSSPALPTNVARRRPSCLRRTPGSDPGRVRAPCRIRASPAQARAMPWCAEARGGLSAADTRV